MHAAIWFATGQITDNNCNGIPQREQYSTNTVDELQQMCMQAVYHGFGINVNPAKLSPRAFEPIVEALMLILGDSTYTVGLSELVCMLLMRMS